MLFLLSPDCSSERRAGRPTLWNQVEQQDVDQKFTWWNSEACGDDEPISCSFLIRKRALKWLCLEAKSGGKTDGVFWLSFVHFKVFDTSLPQERGKRTDMQNQRIAIHMSDLAFCQFDMTHTDNISMNRGWKEFNILSTTRPMTHAVNILKSSIVWQEKASNWFWSFVRYNKLFLKKTLHEPPHAAIGYTAKAAEKKKAGKSNSLNFITFIIFYTRLYSSPLLIVWLKKKNQLRTPRLERALQWTHTSLFLQTKHCWRFDH